MVMYNLRTICDECKKEVVGIETNWRGEPEIKYPLQDFIKIGSKVESSDIGKEWSDVVKVKDSFYHIDCYFKHLLKEHDIEVDWVKMAQNKIDKGETDFKDFFKRFDEWQSSDEHTNVMKTKIQKMVAKVKSD